MHLLVILHVHHLNDNLPSPQMARQPLGKPTSSKTDDFLKKFQTDEFLEKFQTAFDPPPTFSENANFSEIHDWSIVYNVQKSLRRD